MSLLKLSSPKPGTFVLALYEGDYLVWEKEFYEPEMALQYFIKHREIGNRIEIVGDLDL